VSRKCAYTGGAIRQFSANPTGAIDVSGFRRKLQVGLSVSRLVGDDEGIIPVPYQKVLALPGFVQ
jgi:hypothetical protein